MVQKTCKYPRTFHLPWSEAVSKDDRKLGDVCHFLNKEVVVSVKMDGENTSLYRDGLHARSVDSRNHESRTWLKSFHAGIAYNIPEGWRICGENLYAKHSIYYKNLRSFFLVFSVWNEKNKSLSWNDTVDFCENVGLEIVPIVYSGLWDEEHIRALYSDLQNGYDNEDEVEGYVVRIADEFDYDSFGESVAKFVRKDHVATDKHWMYQKLVPNKLRE